MKPTVFILLFPLLIGCTNGLSENAFEELEQLLPIKDGGCKKTRCLIKISRWLVAGTTTADWRCILKANNPGEKSTKLALPPSAAFIELVVF